MVQVTWEMYVLIAKSFCSSFVSVTALKNNKLWLLESDSNKRSISTNALDGDDETIDLILSKLISLDIED